MLQPRHTHNVITVSGVAEFKHRSAERKRVRYYVLDILNKSLSGGVFNLNESGIQYRVICTLRHNITMVFDLGFHNCALVRYNLKRRMMVL